MKHPIEAARAAGLTTINQSLAIMHLSNVPKTPTRLAKDLGISPQSTSLILGRLRGAFLIAPATAALPGLDPQDRRIRPYRLTDKGKALAAALTYTPAACFQPTTETSHF